MRPNSPLWFFLPFPSKYLSVLQEVSMLLFIMFLGQKMHFPAKSKSARLSQFLALSDSSLKKFKFFGDFFSSHGKFFLTWNVVHSDCSRNCTIFCLCFLRREFWRKPLMNSNNTFIGRLKFRRQKFRRISKYRNFVVKNFVVGNFVVLITSWDPGPAQPAPYPRLKNSKKTSKCQVFSFTVLENQKFFEKNFFEKITYSKKWTEWRAGAR